MAFHREESGFFGRRKHAGAQPERTSQGPLPIAERCLVEVFSMSDTKTLKFFIVPQKVGTHFREYQQIESGSALGQALMGRKVGDMVKVGESSFMVKRVERLRV
jgi:hypothetical protein